MKIPFIWNGWTKTKNPPKDYIVAPPRPATVVQDNPVINDLEQQPNEEQV